MDPIATVLAALVAATILGSVAIVHRLHRPGWSWYDVVRARLVLGVPWGSLVVIGIVLCVYLFVQDGVTDPANPVTVPYRAWSYFYPLGMLTASFSHIGPSHLIGNLLGAAVVAPLAEYAWGHYPDSNGGDTGSWQTIPWVRALVLFPLAVCAIGLGTSLFALGPVIGFSGVVFAFAGFAIVRYPIVTLVGLLGVQGALVTLFRALQNPINVYVAEPTPPGPPQWATIAIQGHALGFFIGIVLGILLLRRHERRPDPLRLWLAVLLFGFSKSLWAIYWFGGDNTFVLFQGPGVVVVTILALVVTLAAAGAERPLLPLPLTRRLEAAIGRSSNDSSNSSVDRSLELAAGGFDRVRSARFERIAEIAGGPTASSGVTQRRAAFLIVLLVTATLAGIAVPLNFLVIDDGVAAADADADATIEVEGYTVAYAEGVENELVSPVAVGPFDDAVSLESSGVIVTSERRQIWLEGVTSRRLEFTGEETIHLGEPGWREAVHVERTGWEPIGNETVYQVWLQQEGEERRLAYESDGSRTDVRIDGRSVTLASDGGEFVLEASDGTEAAVAPIPEDGASATAGGITVERDGETVYAASNGTKVAVAVEETYEYE